MKKKCLAVIVILLFIGMSVFPSTAVQEFKDISSVGFDGNTLYVGGSGEGNYTKIQDAIDNSSDGDTVFVYDDSSPYYENILVDKSIDLIGENKFGTIINGTYNTGHEIEIIADNVKIYNFTISDILFVSITIDSSHCHIINNIFKGASSLIDCGLNSNYNNISKNELNYYGYIDLFSSDNNIISENKILHSDYGESAIFLTNSANNIISGNELSNGFYGIVLKTVDFNNNACKNNTIINNNLDSFEWRAIDIDSCNNIYVQGNNISSSDKGIVLFNCTNCELSRNMFYQNLEVGIAITSFSSNNEIINNNFIKNNKNADFSVFSHKNTWNGNYWDNPRTLPYIIFGRIIFFFPWFNFDWNPSQEPYDIEVL